MHSSAPLSWPQKTSSGSYSELAKLPGGFSEVTAQRPIYQHTCVKVVEQVMIRMYAFERRLPEVMMGVNETWRDDFTSAVNDCCFGVNIECVSYLGYPVVFDEKVCCLPAHSIIFIVDYKSAAAKEHSMNSLGAHDRFYYLLETFDSQSSWYNSSH